MIEFGIGDFSITKLCGYQRTIVGLVLRLPNKPKKRNVLPGSCSHRSYLKAGVPQGSILGPLLFRIFITGIVNDINSNIILFADDTGLYIIVDTPQNTASVMNNDLSKIKIWATKWLVTFNPAKSKSLLITRRRADLRQPQLILNNQPIENVTPYKHLGLVLSNDGTWHKHIELITSKAWSRINVMRKLKFQFDRKTLEVIHFTFKRPILEYADVVWNNCTQFDQTEIEKVQLEAGRIVSGITKLVSLASLYNELGWEAEEIINLFFFFTK